MGQFTRMAVVLAAAMALSLASCATTRDRAQQTEDLLAAAGFKLKPAAPPEKPLT